MCDALNCVCDICCHNYRGQGCEQDCENYGEEDLRWPHDCDYFELDDSLDEDDTEIYDSEPALVKVCPVCGNDALYNGLEYECDDCGFIGDID